MKKALALLLALALLALPGCGGDSPLYGEVVAVERASTCCCAARRGILPSG